MGDGAVMNLGVSALRRGVLASRAALHLAATPGVVAVRMETHEVTVENRSGRAVRLRSDVTAVLRGGTRIGVVVAPRGVVAGSVEWPARAGRAVVSASVPRLFVMVSGSEVGDVFDKRARGCGASAREGVARHPPRPLNPRADVARREPRHRRRFPWGRGACPPV